MDKESMNYSFKILAFSLYKTTNTKYSIILRNVQN